MNRALKWILIAGGSLAVLLIAAIVLIPLLVDVNHYKPQIEARVQEATGRTLSIGGPIDLSVFPWIGVAVSDLRLGSPDGFGDTPLAAVGRFEAQVRLLPLLSREIEVKRIVLEAPAIALVRLKDGRTNWDFKMTGGSPPAREKDPTGPSPPADPALAALTAEEIAIRNGRLTFDDQTAGRRQAVDDLTLVVRDVSLDRPLAVEFAARLNDLPLRLEGTIGPVGNPPASRPLDYDLVITALDELVVSLKGSARDLQKQPAVDLAVDVAAFAPRPLFERLDQPFPLQTTDPEALGSVAFQARLKGGAQGVTLDAGKIQLDQTRIDFKAEAAQFDKPRITFEARIDDIDADRYLPAETDGEKKASPTAKAPANEAAVDYGPLRRMLLDARLEVAKLKINRARLQDVVLKVKGRDGRFTLAPFDAALYGGQAQIAGQLDVTRNQPRADLAIKLTDMLVGPFLADVAQKDVLEGRLVTAIDLQFTGDRPETIRRTLNGQGRLTFNDGAIVGIDLAGMVRNLQAAFGAGERLAEKPKTDFTELDIPFELKNGVFQTAASNMKSPLMRLLANGQADLVQETLNFRINPKFVATLVGQGDTQDRRGVMVPVLVSGSFDQPRFQPDLKSIARQQVEEKIVESDKLKEVFEKNEALKPYEDTAKDLIRGLMDQ